MAGYTAKLRFMTSLSDKMETKFKTLPDSVLLLHFRIRSLEPQNFPRQTLCMLL